LVYTFRGGLYGLGPIGQMAFDNAGNLYGVASGGGTFGYGLVYKLTLGADGVWREMVIYNHETSLYEIMGGGVFFDKTGNLYSTTFSWFAPTYGSVFQLSPTAEGQWTKTTVHSFVGGLDGASPTSQLVVDDAGDIFGSAQGAGVAGDGLIFEFVPSGNGTWTENVLYNFKGGIDGFQPLFLLRDSSGALYGTTATGGGGRGCTGSDGCGTFFKLVRGTNGQWTKRLLYAFSQANLAVGMYPIIYGFDNTGNVYGTTLEGGTQVRCYDGCGTVFQFVRGSNDLWTKNLLWEFTGSEDGWAPSALALGLQGDAFVSASLGGDSGLSGTVIQLTASSDAPWKETTIDAFPSTDGNTPDAGLVRDPAGNLYGTTMDGGTYNKGAVFRMTPAGNGKWNEDVLFSFNDPAVNGDGPSALIMDAVGNLYGTTFQGGFPQAGTAYELLPSGHGAYVEKVLYTFAGGKDGLYPFSPLILDAAGNLYGATEVGGDRNLGTVYELSPGPNGQWTESVIHSFTGEPDDGSMPTAGLVMDSAGNLYGTSTQGGSGSCRRGDGVQVGCGAVFELSPRTGGGWTGNILYSFTGTAGDGQNPNSPLVIDAGGNLYGTTPETTPNHGTIFKLSPSGSSWSESILYTFGGGVDGADPAGGLILDGAGNLYGTTVRGGKTTCATYGCGTVFRLTPKPGGVWNKVTLYNFTGIQGDGNAPAAPLIFDNAGNLLGTTFGGGSANQGAVFQIRP